MHRAVVSNLGERAVHDIPAALRHGPPAVAAAERHAPAELQAVSGKLLDDPGPAPNAIALRTKPLRPVVSVKARRR